MDSNFSQGSDPKKEAERGAVYGKNLALLEKEAISIKERKRLLASILANEIALPEDAGSLDRFSDGLYPTFFSKALNTASGRSVRFDPEAQIAFLSAVVTRLPPEVRFYGGDFPEEGEVIAKEAHDRVAYLKNRFADDAYFRLTAHLTSPRASYFSSFSDACEEVYHGQSEYCLLPIENSSDGKLLRFYALIDKYELKIAAECDIETADGSGYTRYALLRRKILSLTPPEAEGGKRAAEFQIVTGDGFTLSDVFSAAKEIGIAIRKIDSAPLSYKENGYSHYLICTAESGKDNEFASLFLTFLLFLSLSLPQCTPLGFYTMLEG